MLINQIGHSKRKVDQFFKLFSNISLEKILDPRLFERFLPFYFKYKIDRNERFDRKL